MSLRLLLIRSGGLEILAGLLALISPAPVVSLLLGVPVDWIAAILTGLFGAGVFALGLACLKARDDIQSPAGLAVSIGMTSYNVPAAVAMTWTATGSGLGGLLLWGAGIVHSVFGVLFLLFSREQSDNQIERGSVNRALLVNQYPSVRIRQSQELIIRRNVVKKSIASMVMLTIVTLLSPLVWAQDGNLSAPRINTRLSAPPSDATHWSYEGEKGPKFWGKLDPDFSLCADGHSQSPVDIATTSPALLPKLRKKFSPTNLRIVHHEHMADEINNGHTIQINYSEGDTMTIGNTTHELIQFHFHAPSEHTVHGKHYPMEMHFVHKSPSGALAVIGVFIERGVHNAAFEPIFSNLPEQKGVESHFEHVQVNVDDLLPHSNKSYRYDGSLTTPPCSEGVKGIVMQSPIHLSAAQIDWFTSRIEGNNRPVQPLHDRVTVSDAVTEEVMAR